MQFADSDVIQLQWSSVGSLTGEAYYVPKVTFSHFGLAWTDEAPWTKDLSWTLSEHAYLLDLSDDGVFSWSVQVMLKTGTDPRTGKPVGVPLSPTGEVRTLTWIKPAIRKPTVPP